MSDLKTWAKAKSGKGTPHIVEEHHEGGGVTVHKFASKKEAHAKGAELKGQGKFAAVHAADSEWSKTAQNERMTAEKEGRAPDIAGAVDRATQPKKDDARQRSATQYHAAESAKSFEATAARLSSVGDHGAAAKRHDMAAEHHDKAAAHADDPHEKAHHEKAAAANRTAAGKAREKASGGGSDERDRDENGRFA